LNSSTLACRKIEIPGNLVLAAKLCQTKPVDKF